MTNHACVGIETSYSVDELDNDDDMEHNTFVYLYSQPSKIIAKPVNIDNCKDFNMLLAYCVVVVVLLRTYYKSSLCGRGMFRKKSVSYVDSVNVIGGMTS